VTFIAASVALSLSSTRASSTARRRRGAGPRPGSRPCRTDRCGHVGQQKAQPLVVDDLAAERGSLVGVAGGLVQGGLC